MLKGLSVPLTPQGKSTLATLPPWHRSAVAAVLPPGLAVDENSPPSQAMEMARIMPDVAGD
jgi:acetoacetate decarboxylase